MVSILFFFSIMVMTRGYVTLLGSALYLGLSLQWEEVLGFPPLERAVICSHFFGRMTLPFPSVLSTWMYCLVALTLVAFFGYRETLLFTRPRFSWTECD